jgi:hypothetical protein
MNSSASSSIGNQGAHLPPYANGIAQFVLAAISALAIGLTVTNPDSAGAIWWILVLGVGQALVFWLATSLPMRYRVTSAIALLCAFLAAYTPGLLQATPLSAGPAVALAVVGSLPMWGVAVERLVNARRDTSNT